MVGLALLAIPACGHDKQNRAVSDWGAEAGDTGRAGGAGSTDGACSSGDGCDAGVQGGAAAAGAGAADSGCSSASGCGAPAEGGAATLGEGGSGGGLPEHPISKICGDGIRDPATEECDDFGLSQTSSCTSDCRVRAQPIPPAPAGTDEAKPSPSLGSAPHVAVGTETGLAITYQDRGSIWVQEFGSSATGATPPIAASEGFMPLVEGNSSIAALPDGGYAVAWTDGAGGTPDVRMRKLSAAQLGPARLAHDDTAGFQQDPDALWIGDRLIVAWTDLLSVKYRTFDVDLNPLAPEQVLTGDAAIESSVVLTAFAGSWAAAIRANEEGLESIHVAFHGTTWSTPPTLPSSIGDRPALVELDDTHLLLVFSVDDDPDAGNVSISKLRGSLLSIDAPGAVPSFPLFAPDADAGAIAESQIRPNAVRVGAISYLGWQTSSAAGTRSFVAPVELAVGQPNNLSIGPNLQLPVTSAPGEQANLHLSASSLFPAGALISLWQVATEAPPSTALTLDFRPSPFVFLPN